MKILKAFKSILPHKHHHHHKSNAEPLPPKPDQEVIDRLQKERKITYESRSYSVPIKKNLEKNSSTSNPNLSQDDTFLTTESSRQLRLTTLQSELTEKRARVALLSHQLNSTNTELEQLQTKLKQLEEEKEKEDHQQQQDQQQQQEKKENNAEQQDSSKKEQDDDNQKEQEQQQEEEKEKQEKDSSAIIVTPAPSSTLPPSIACEIMQTKARIRVLESEARLLKQQKDSLEIEIESLQSRIDKIISSEENLTKWRELTCPKPVPRISFPSLFSSPRLESTDLKKKKTFSLSHSNHSNESKSFHPHSEGEEEKQHQLQEKSQSLLPQESKHSHKHKKKKRPATLNGLPSDWLKEFDELKTTIESMSGNQKKEMEDLKVVEEQFIELLQKLKQEKAESLKQLQLEQPSISPMSEAVPSQEQLEKAARKLSQTKISPSSSSSLSLHSTNYLSWFDLIRIVVIVSVVWAIYHIFMMWFEK